MCSHSFPRHKYVGFPWGNEVLGVAEFELWGALLGAAKNIYEAVKKLNLTDIQIYTPHAQSVFAHSYPLLELFSEIGSPVCLNAYPFLVYMANPKGVNINYPLFLDSKGIYDPKLNFIMITCLKNYAASEDAGFKNMEIIVTETGRASQGEANETAATVNNAKIYNYNLRQRLAKGKGTPLRPKIVVKAYVFAMFNENLKPGPTSERNCGLFKANESIAYDIGFHGISSSADVEPASDVFFVDDEMQLHRPQFHRLRSPCFFFKDCWKFFLYLIVVQDIGAQGWFRPRHFLLPISAAALLLLLR